MDQKQEQAFFRVDLDVLETRLKAYKSAIPFADAPVVYTRGFDPEYDQEQTEIHYRDKERSVWQETDAAITRLCENRKWPRTRSLLRWAAARRFEWLLLQVRTWQCLPESIVFQSACTEPFCESAVLLPLLTSFYTRYRQFQTPDKPMTPMLFGGPPVPGFPETSPVEDKSQTKG